jgi:hypothetical protein
VTTTTAEIDLLLAGTDRLLVTTTGEAMATPTVVTGLLPGGTGLHAGTTTEGTGPREGMTTGEMIATVRATEEIATETEEGQS